MFNLSKRWEMVSFMASGILIVYTLRVNMSVAVEKIVDDLDWSEAQKGLILSSFYWGYAIGQVPGARLANRYGAKLVFGLSVLVPSILTLFVPMACKTSFVFALLLRALIGLSEAATFPCIFQFFPKWVAPKERTLMVSSTISGMYMGEIVGFGISGYVAESHLVVNGTSIGGWPAVFYIFGAIGIVWYPFWRSLAYESPQDHPFITQEELDFINAPETDSNQNEDNRNSTVNPSNKYSLNAEDKETLLGDDSTHSLTVSFLTEHYLHPNPEELSNSNKAGPDDEYFEYDEFATVEPVTGLVSYRATSASRSRDVSISASMRNPNPFMTAALVTAAASAEGNVTNNKRIRRKAPWGVFFTHRATLVVLLGKWMYDWIGFMLLSEMPSFLTDQLDMNLSDAGAFSAIPFITLFICTISFGNLFDHLQREKNWTTREVRQYAQFVGFGGPAVFLVVCGYMSNVPLAFTCMVLAQGLLGACQSGLACVLLDIAPRYSARFYSVANMVGAVAGICSPLIVSAFISIWDGPVGWQAVFILTAVQAFIVLIFWVIFQTSDYIPELNTPGDVVREDECFIRCCF